MNRQHFARHLRNNQTDAERKLWGALRKRSFCGYRFHRQAAIGPYVADFLCREKALVIEVDGFGHADAADQRRDEARSRYLEASGFTVFRATNADVFNNLDGVLDGILLKLEALPSRYHRAPKEPPQSFGQLPQQS